MLIKENPVRYFLPEQAPAIRDLARQGRYRDALAIYQDQANLLSREEAEEKSITTTSHLYLHLGAPRTADALILRGARRWPQSPHLIIRRATVLVNSGRIEESIAECETVLQSDQATAEDRFLAYTLLARVHLAYKDIDEAEAHIRLAEKEATDEDDTITLHLLRSHLEEKQDRYPEALQAVEEAAQLNPHNAHALFQRIHLLDILNREEEVMEGWQNLLEKTDSALYLPAYFYALYDRQRYDEAARLATEWPQRMPLLEKKTAAVLREKEILLHLYRGEKEQALTIAGETRRPVYLKLVEAIKTSPVDAIRKVLDVPFIRQHDKTCVPSTFAALAAYWERPVDHLSLAAEICYDGTQNSRERDWADRHGWVTAEFTLTPEIASALIDRGIPFALTTIDSSHAHMQAIIGYDQRAGMFLVRDPYYKFLGEWLQQPTLERYAGWGPRCLLLLPPEEKHRMDQLELPDQAAWDGLYAVQQALWKNQRTRAGELLAEHFPPEKKSATFIRDHAAWRIALYDSDTVRQLEAIENLLAAFPKDTLFMNEKAYLLQTLGKREDYLAFVTPLLSDPESPLELIAGYLEETLFLPGRVDENLRRLTHLRRRIPLQDRVLTLLGRSYWHREERAKALRALRWASTLEQLREPNVWHYFNALRVEGQTSPGLQYLQDRADRFGAQSSQPIITYVTALYQAGQIPEGDAYLSHHQDHPDPDLAAFSCLENIYRGNLTEAERQLETLSDQLPTLARVKLLAHHELIRGNLEAALNHWLTMYRLQPHNLEFLIRCADLQARTQGMESAIARYQEAAAEFPHNPALRNAWLDTWYQYPRPGYKEELERFRRDFPWLADGFRREAVWQLENNQDTTKALALTREAIAADPHDAEFHRLEGFILSRRGQMAEATQALFRSLDKNPDLAAAVYNLLDASHRPAERAQRLHEIRDRFIPRSLNGQLLFALNEMAASTLLPDQRLAFLQSIQTMREDLWPSHDGVVEALFQMGRDEEALTLAEEARTRFPSEAKFPYQAGLIHFSRKDLPAARDCFLAAVRLAPDWSPPTWQLSRLAEREGQTREGLDVLQRFLARNPLDAATHNELAEAYRFANLPKESLQALLKAVRLFPENTALTDKLRQWAAQDNDFGGVLALFQELHQQRPDDPAITAEVARCHLFLGQWEQAANLALAAYHKNPDSYPLRELCLQALAPLGRVDQVESILQNPIRGYEAGISLQLLKAWWNQRQNNSAEARRIYQGILSQDRLHQGARQAYLDFLKGEEDWKTVATVAGELLALSPNDTAALQDSFWAQFENHQKEAMLDTGERLLELSVCDDVILARMREVALEIFSAPDILAFRWNRFHDKASPQQKLLGEAILAHRTRNHEASTAAFLQYLSLPLPQRILTEPALDEVLMGPGRKKILRACRQLMTGETAPASLGWLFFYTAHRLNGYSPMSLYRNICGRSWTPARRAVHEEILSVVGARRSRLLIRIYQTFHRQNLRLETRTWAVMGYALICSISCQAARSWMRDWRSRPDVPPFALHNLIIAHARLKSYGSIPEVVSILDQLPADHTHEERLLHRCLFLNDMGNPQEMIQLLEGEIPRLQIKEHQALVRAAQFRLECLDALSSGDSPRLTQHLSEWKSWLRSSESAKLGLDYWHLAKASLCLQVKTARPHLGLLKRLFLPRIAPPRALQ